eukprot:g3872.t1
MIRSSASRFHIQSIVCAPHTLSVARFPGSILASYHSIFNPLQRSFTRVKCQSDENSETNDSIGSFFSSWNDEVIVYGTALFLTSSSLISWYFLRDPIEDLIYGGDLTNLLGTSISFGDVVALLLWTVAYYYISPLQLLLIFLGKIDTDRPSDWILYKLGQLTNKPVDRVDYEAKGVLYGVMMGTIVIMALLTTTVISLLVDGATWSVSTGIGACMAAGLFEVGRPPRLNLKEKQKLDKQFEDFVEFADQYLQRTGSCHESEIFKNFRNVFNQYEDEETLSDVNLRRFVRQWAPKSKKTGNGFFKKVSLRQKLQNS